MSRDIILKDKQTGYEVVAECVREHWNQAYYGTVVVLMAISHDGENYCKTNEIVIPQDDDIEFLNDWWEGEKYIKIYSIANLDDIEMPTSDVVAVVRCKDCKYYTEHHRCTYDDECGRCDHPQQTYEDECFDMWVETRPNDYCSYGERREE